MCQSHYDQKPYLLVEYVQNGLIRPFCAVVKIRNKVVRKSESQRGTPVNRRTPHVLKRLQSRPTRESSNIRNSVQPIPFLLFPFPSLIGAITAVFQFTGAVHLTCDVQTFPEPSVWRAFSDFVTHKDLNSVYFQVVHFRITFSIDTCTVFHNQEGILLLIKCLVRVSIPETVQPNVIGPHKNRLHLAAKDAQVRCFGTLLPWLNCGSITPVCARLTFSDYTFYFYLC